MRTKAEILNDIQTKESELVELRKELGAANMRLLRDRSTDYKTRKNMLIEASKIFELILKPGDMIKVTGSRTSPLRKVMRIHPGKVYPNGYYSPGDVVTYVCSYNRKTKTIECDDTNIITCGTNKVTSYMKDGEWVTAKEVVKTQNMD